MRLEFAPQDLYLYVVRFACKELWQSLLGTRFSSASLRFINFALIPSCLLSKAKTKTSSSSNQFQA